jgi:hypothetical protein
MVDSLHGHDPKPRPMGSVANFLGRYATPMGMKGLIPPTNRIPERDTFRLSSATGLSGAGSVPKSAFHRGNGMMSY